MKIEMLAYTTMATQLTTVFTLPARLSAWISCAPPSAPPMVPTCHDHSELQIDIAKRAMFSCCDDRLANNVRQVRSDRVIPIHSHQAQRRTCNETSAYAKKAAQNSNNKADNDQIKRIDVRVGDWKKHDSSPTAPQEPEQNRGYRIQNNGLTSYEQDGDDRIKDAMLRFEPVQPVAQNMED